MNAAMLREQALLMDVDVYRPIGSGSSATLLFFPSEGTSTVYADKIRSLRPRFKCGEGTRGGLSGRVES